MGSSVIVGSVGWRRRARSYFDGQGGGRCGGGIVEGLSGGAPWMRWIGVEDLILRICHSLFLPRPKRLM